MALDHQSFDLCVVIMPDVVFITLQIKLEYTAGGTFSLEGCPDHVTHDATGADGNQQGQSQLIQQQQQQNLQQQGFQHLPEPAISANVLEQSLNEQLLLSSCNAGKAEASTSSPATTNTASGGTSSSTADKTHHQASHPVRSDALQ
jgi:hypothetical protein